MKETKIMDHLDRTLAELERDAASLQEDLKAVNGIIAGLRAYRKVRSGNLASVPTVCRQTEESRARGEVREAQRVDAARAAAAPVVKVSRKAKAEKPAGKQANVKAPNGMAKRVMAAAAGFAGVFSRKEILDKLADPELTAKQVNDALVYLGKTGKLQVAQAGKAHYQALYQLPVAMKPADKPAEAAKPTEVPRAEVIPTPKDNKADLKAKLETALSQRDRAREQGKYDLAEKWQAKVDEYSAALGE